MTEILGEVPPCNACGSKAVVRDKEMRERSVADTGPRVEQVRVCTNPDCITKSPERPMGVYV